MADSQKLVSIIIRTKNEEKWISECLKSIFSQNYTNFEIILVDNESTDKTVEKASLYPIKLVKIKDFLPGLAINLGIRKSHGEYIVCLSAHCIPTSKFWLENLVKDLSHDDVAGVYGRQEPLPYSSDLDKRDLITIFGLDKKIQIKDSFFHNANSAFKRDIWIKIPFDEMVTNIEDRVWGQKVIASGFKIVYEPEASVFHWHGVHQDSNPDRCKSVVKILESLPGILPKITPNSSSKDIVAIIPIKGLPKVVGGKSLLKNMLHQLKESKYLKKIYVAVDDVETKNVALSVDDVEVIWRPDNLSNDHVSVIEVCKYALDFLEKDSIYPDHIMILEETYPNRTIDFVDALIEDFISSGVDTLIAVKEEKRAVWHRNHDGQISMVGEGFMPRKLKSTSILIGLLGLGCITHASYLRSGSLFSGNLGVYPIHNDLMSYEHISHE